MNTKVNEIKISYREKNRSRLMQKICSSQDAASLLYSSWNKDDMEIQESFKMLLLNNSNRIKAVFMLSTGGITATLVDVRILFAVLLKSLTTAVIIAHNHPSGILKPSEADKRLTQKIKKAGELLDIKVLDHLILAPDGSYFSFADEGIL